MTNKNFYDLISAIKHGQAKHVGELLRKGANPNVLGAALRQGEGRISALGIAIKRGDVAMVELLLEHGANLHDIDHLYSAGADVLAGPSSALATCMPAPATPLHGLAQSGQWKNGLLKLIRGGADINRLDPGLNSPLDLAVARAVRMCALGAQQSAPAYRAIHGLIAAGATPSATVLASHAAGTAIGDALRMYRIDAAVASGDQQLVWHVLEMAHDKDDADCQAAGARLDMRGDNPDMAEVLDL